LNIGSVVQVAGPVVDVEFPGALPPIYNALTCDYTVENEPVSVTHEVQQQLEDRWVPRAPRATRAIPRSGVGPLVFLSEMPREGVARTGRGPLTLPEVLRYIGVHP
jgi:ATP synthase alpha/beta subunit-like protein